MANFAAVTLLLSKAPGSASLALRDDSHLVSEGEFEGVQRAASEYEAFYLLPAHKCGADTGHMKLSQVPHALKHHGPYPHAPALGALGSQHNTSQNISGNLIFSAEQ